MKLTTAELGNKLDLARSRFPLHSVHQHYKGGVYEVVGHALNTDDMVTTTILYRRIAGPEFNAIAETGITYSRPMMEWAEVVHDEANNLHLARFRRIA